MNRLIRILAIQLIMFFAVVSYSSAQSLSSPGIRFEIGVDDEGRYGLVDSEINIVKEQQSYSIEVGIGIFNGLHRTGTQTTVTAFQKRTSFVAIALMANLLYHHSPVSPAYFTMGVGAGPVWINWRQLRRPAGFPYYIWEAVDRDDATTAGIIFNIGAGYRFLEWADLRLQGRSFAILGAPGAAPSTIPVVTLSLGLRW